MLRRLLVAASLLAAFCGVASAQQGSLVQNSGSMLNAATATAVGTNFNTIASQSTATIVVPAGLYAYITGIYLSACQDATSTANVNLQFTSTNITGTPDWAYGLAAVANTCYQQMLNFATPLKSAAAGTNVTVVSPTSTAHTGFGIDVFYYLAP
jgi:hypothetical protein